MTLRLAIITVSFLMTIGCRTENSSTKDVEDIGSMRAIPNQPGQFSVVCRYHDFDDEPEIRSAEEIRNNQVCQDGSGGVNNGCNYNGSTGSSGVFTVITGEQLYSQRVDGYDDAKLFCRRDLAALYDGDDLYTFNFQTRQFSRENSVDDSANIIMAGTNKIVMAYDQDNIYVFDPDNQSSWNRYNSVEDNAAIFSFRLFDRALLVYDGDNYHSYCKGNWDRNNSVADNDQSIQISIAGNLLFSGGYSINADTCQTNWVLKNASPAESMGEARLR